MEIENTTANVEATNPDTGNTGDAFLEAMGFGNAADSTNATDFTETEADQPQAEEQTDATAEAGSEKKDDNGRDYAIRYKGKEETLHLTDDQLTAMLQKGRDYDEVRKQRDELLSKSKNLDGLERMADYFAANNGLSRDELMEYITSQTSDDGILKEIEAAYPDAPEDVKKELLESRKAKLAAQKEAEADEAAQADIAALHAEYPDADISNLPSDVQADIENGMKPVEAMRMHELRELRKTKAELDKQIESLKKEKDNRSKAPGRLKDTAGDNGLDAFMKGFMKGG